MAKKLNDYDKIIVPLINANEDEVIVTEWLVKPWEKVKTGDIVCILESTKITFDVETDKSGYLYPAINEGLKTKVGSSLAYIFQSDNPDQLKQIEKNQSNSFDRLISRKAQTLLEENKIAINELPGIGPIKEYDVISYIEEKNQSSFNKDPRLKKLNVNQKSLLLYCAGDHADVLYESVISGREYEIMGFIDYLGKLKIKEKFGLPVFHKSQLQYIRELGVKKIHINTNSYVLTKEIFKISSELEFSTVNLFHSSSVISPTSIMGVNIFVGANSIIGTQTRIGDFSKILNGASIAHHSKIGKNCQISDGSRIAGNVVIGNNCLIGLNATVNMKVNIGNDVTVISGANVYDNIENDSIIRN